MELTTEEKLDRLEAGLAEIGARLDALELKWREWLEPLAGDVERWPAQQEAAVNEDEDQIFSEALERLEMVAADNV